MKGVSQLSLGMKIILILLCPLSVVVYLLTQVTSAKLEALATLREIESHVELGGALGSLVHEMQRERMYSATYLGSQGRLFGSELTHQMKVTDQRRENLRKIEESGSKPEAISRLSNELDGINRKLLELPEIREGILARRTSFEEAFNFYTRLNESIDQTFRILSHSVSDPKIEREIEAFGNLIGYKEAKGQERALISHLLSQGQIPFSQLKALIDIASNQKIYLNNFYLFASDEQIVILERNRDLELADRIQEFRDNIIDKGASVLLEMDLNYWMEMATENIERLQTASTLFAESLLNRSAQMIIEERQSLVFGGLILYIFALVTTYLCYFLIRSILEPVRAGLEVLTEIRGGRVPAPPVLRYKGEISDLVMALCRSVANLARKSKSLEEMAQLAEFHPAPLFLIDSSDKIVVTNQAANAIFADGKYEKLIGQGWDTAVPQCPLKEIRATDSQTSWREGAYHHELAIGGRLLVLTKKPMPDLGLTYLYCTDVTELRTYETRANMYTAVADAANEAIMLVDLSGSIFYVSPGFEKLTGYKPADALGMNPRILKSGQQSLDFYRELWDTIRSGRVWSQEIVNKKKDGTFFNAWVTIAPILGDHGLPKAYSCLFTDITEIKRLELILKEAAIKAERTSQFKSIFLANMSHEIRTPMNAILGMITLLAETPLSDEQKKYLKIFDKAGKTLLNIINDILDFSKVEAGQLVLGETEFSLCDLIDHVESLMKPLAEDKLLEFRCKTSIQSSRSLKGDPCRLNQILVNLIGNAIKFTKQGFVELKVVEQRAEEEKITLLFSIQDTGIGIPPEQKDTLFESFKQGGLGRSSEFGGTGLGLAISKSLVTLMGGTLVVESEVAKGSIFSFTLSFPFNDVVSAKKTESQARVDFEDQAQPNEGGRKRKILLADDSEDNRFLIQAYLKGLCCEIDCVSNGLEAVELAARKHFDLILMDIQMPIMNGHQGVAEIRASEKRRGSPCTPIVAISAHALSEEREMSLKLGCDEYLTKPLQKETLLNTVRRFLGGN